MRRHTAAFLTSLAAGCPLRPIHVGLFALFVVGCYTVVGQAQSRPLEVPGWEPASHVEPDDKTGKKPIVIVLHGNWDRPEWECDTWAPVASWYGWVLCPRGKRQRRAPAGADRWTYGKRETVIAEIKATIDALVTQYPDRVTRDGAVLAGFSLGAIMAPGLGHQMGPWRAIFLVEGGTTELTNENLRKLKKAGVAAIGMAMSAPGRRRRAQRYIPRLEKLGFRTAFVDMDGAGHNYSRTFTTEGRKALKKLLAE